MLGSALALESDSLGWLVASTNCGYLLGDFVGIQKPSRDSAVIRHALSGD
jgi:hypothetical protein